MAIRVEFDPPAAILSGLWPPAMLRNAKGVLAEKDTLPAKPLALVRNIVVVL